MWSSLMLAKVSKITKVFSLLFPIYVFRFWQVAGKAVAMNMKEWKFAYDVIRTEALPTRCRDQWPCHGNEIVT